MDIRKLTALLAAAAMSVCLCSCSDKEIHETDSDKEEDSSYSAKDTPKTEKPAEATKPEEQPDTDDPDVEPDQPDDNIEYDVEIESISDVPAEYRAVIDRLGSSLVNSDFAQLEECLPNSTRTEVKDIYSLYGYGYDNYFEAFRNGTITEEQEAEIESQANEIMGKYDEVMIEIPVDICELFFEYAGTDLFEVDSITKNQKITLDNLNEHWEDIGGIEGYFDLLNRPDVEIGDMYTFQIYMTDPDGYRTGENIDVICVDGEYQIIGC